MAIGRRGSTQRRHQGHRPLAGQHHHGLAHREQEFIFRCAHQDLAAEALLDRQLEIGPVADGEAKLMIVSRSARGQSISLANLETWRAPGDFSIEAPPRLLRIDRTTDPLVAVGHGPTQARLGDRRVDHIIAVELDVLRIAEYPPDDAVPQACSPRLASLALVPQLGAARTGNDCLLQSFDLHPAAYLI